MLRALPLRGALVLAAVAGAATSLSAGSGDFSDCPNQPGASTWVVPVRVLTPGLRVIEGLQAGDFAVSVNQVPQRLCGFTQTRWPVSVGILVDNSASMRAPFNGHVEEGAATLKATVERLLSVSGPQDEYFLAYASDQAAVRVGFTHDVDRIRAGLTGPPRGRTALIDGIVLALNELRKASHPTRSLVVLSDGNDNGSVYKLGELADAFLSAPIPIFLLAPADPWARKKEHPEDTARREALIRLAGESGGYVVQATDRQLVAAAGDMASAIRLPYVLQFAGPLSLATKDRIVLKVEVRGVHPRPLVFFPGE